MNKLIESQLMWVCILLTAVLFFGGCMMSACAKENEDSVVWKGSKAYEKRVGSFKIKPDQAAKMVLAEMKKPGAIKLKRNGGIFAEAEFIIGNWYWFGVATKTEIYTTGYYVDSDTGKIEYRESDKTVKLRTRKLTKDTWSKITSLPESSFQP